MMAKSQIILLVMLVLIQTARPNYRTPQNDDVRLNSSEQYRGGD